MLNAAPLHLPLSYCKKIKRVRRPALGKIRTHVQEIGHSMRHRAAQHTGEDKVEVREQKKLNYKIKKRN